MRLSHVLAMIVAAGALSGAVQSQPAITPLIVHDGNGVAQPLCEFKPDGTNLAGCTIEYSWNGTSWVLRPADASGRPFVDVFSLPNVTLSAGANTIGSIANTSFGAAQSGTWNVGLNAGGNVIGVVGNVQGSVTSGQSGPLVQGAVTTGAPSYASGQTSPLSLDASGNLRVNVVAGGGSGGTSSTFGSAFPAIGTAIGAKNGANMVNLAADGSNNLLVNCAAGCSASSSTYGAALPSGGQAVGVNVVSSAPTYAAGNLQAPTMDTAGNLRVSAASLPLPTGAATAAAQTAIQSAPGTSAGSAITVQGSASGVAVPVSGTVTANAGSGTFAAQDSADAGVGAGAAPAKAQLGAVQFNSAAPTLTTGQTVAAQADVNGNLKVNCATGCSGGGAVTMASGAVASGAYALGAIPDLGPSGQLHSDISTLINSVNSPPALGSASGGWTPKLLNALSTTPVTIKGSAGQLGMAQCYNPNGAQIYLQVFDTASPTLGTTAPKLSIPIAPAATGGFALSQVGVQFSNAIVVATTTTATGSTAPATAPDCNALFN